MRLGVYSDIAYRRDEDGVLSTHQAFIEFVTALPPRVEELVLFGRVDPTPGRSHYVISGDRVRLVPLPHYARVTSLRGQARALRHTLRIFARELADVDAVWIFGPHPIAVTLALAARRHRMPLFLGVRQDYPAYIAARLPSRKWFWAVGVAHGLDLVFRLLARSAPTVTVGDELARRYGRGTAAVLASRFSLVSARDVVDVGTAIERPWGAEWSILSVGRLDPEKNPLLLVEVLSLLRRQESRWRLTIVGDGPLRDAVERRAEALGVADAIHFLGYVPQGEGLWRLYRSHQVFLHVSLTEGVPQVLFEAQAAGTPLVATAVGGVATALSPGAALLIPPADADAAASAVVRIGSDVQLRRTMIKEGLRNAHDETMEIQLDRIAAFFNMKQCEPPSEWRR